MKIYLEILPETIQCIKMTDEEYFSEKYRGYISNSRLALINPEQGGSPEKYADGFEGGFNASFQLGSAVHGIILQPDEFVIPDIHKPTAKLGMFAEEVYKFRQEGNSIHDSIELARVSADYYQKGFTENRRRTAIKKSLDFYLKRMKYVEDPVKVPLFLSEKDAETTKQCINSVEKSQPMLNYLRPKGIASDPEVFNEYAILCEIKVVREGEEDQIIKIKAKLDSFSIDHENEEIILNDLKTTGRPVAWFMGQYITNDLGEQVWAEGSFEKYRYYRQAAFYTWLLQAVNKTKYPDYTYKTNFLVVETIPDYKCKVFRIQNKWIQLGLKETKELIILAANEQKSKLTSTGDSGTNSGREE